MKGYTIDKDLFERFKNGNFYISLKTQDEWDLFMRFMQQEPYITKVCNIRSTWNDFGEPDMESRWDSYGEKTVIHYDKGGDFEEGDFFEGDFLIFSSRDELSCLNTVVVLNKILKKENAMKSLQELISIHGDREVSEEVVSKIFGIVKQWTPEYRGTYWYIGDSGRVYDNYWIGSRDWSGDSTDILRWRMGNVYETEEEAEFARDKKQFLVKMERDFENNSEPIDWKNKDQNKFCIYIDHYEQELDIDSTSGYETSTLFTTNIDWLKQYIKDNEANIKKYVFGVRE